MAKDNINQTAVNQDAAVAEKYVADKTKQLSQKLTAGASNSALAKVISPLMSKAGQVTNLANQIGGSAKNISPTLGQAGQAVAAISGQVNNVTDKAKGAITNVTKQAQQAVSSAMGKFTSGLSSSLGGIFNQATSILGKPLSSFSNMFPNVSKTLFNSKNGDIGSLTSLLGAGTGDIDSKISSILSDGLGALSAPVSFISKPIEDVMQGISSMAMGTRMTDLLDELAADQIANIVKATGLKIESNSDLKKAIQKATNEFFEQNRLSSSILTEWEQEHLQPATSSLTDYDADLINGARSTLTSSAPATETYDSIDASAADVAIAALGTLAANLQNKLNVNNQETMENQVNVIMEEDASSYNNASKLVTEEVLDESALTGMVVGLDQSNNYPSKTTADGASLYSSFGSNSISTVDSLYGIAETVCPSLKPLATQNYRNTKDLYDILVALAAAFGLPDLLHQLLYYGKTEDMKLYDDRTQTLLKEAAPTVAVRGDVFTFGVIARDLGPTAFANLMETLLILDANMLTSEKQGEVFQSILDIFKMSTFDLFVAKQYTDQQVLQADNVVLMSTTNTEVIDSAIGEFARAMVQTAKVAYTAPTATASKTHAQRVAAATKAA